MVPQVVPQVALRGVHVHGYAFLQGQSCQLDESDPLRVDGPQVLDDVHGEKQGRVLLVGCVYRLQNGGGCRERDEVEDRAAEADRRRGVEGGNGESGMRREGAGEGDRLRRRDGGGRDVDDGLARKPWWLDFGSTFCW